MATPSSIDGMQRVLMETQPRRTPGEYRDEQVWIGTRGDSPVDAEFVPPHHARVAELIDDLAVFASRDDVPSLTAVATGRSQSQPSGQSRIVVIW